MKMNKISDIYRYMLDLTKKQIHNLLFIILSSFVVVGIMYFITSANLRFIFISVLFLLSIFFLDKKNILFYIFIAFIPPLSESLLINYCEDTWTYKSPFKLGIPIWLFPIWGIVLISYIGLYNIFKDTKIFSLPFMNEVIKTNLNILNPIESDPKMK
jgi:hypothetical protein